MRLQLEPCKSPAYASVDYKFGGGWQTGQRLGAGDDPLFLGVPGAAALGYGLFIEVSLQGNAEDLSIHAKLSACAGAGSCNGDVPLVGGALSALGFPLSLLEFDDLSFKDQCPADLSSLALPVGAAIGALVLLGAAGGAVVFMMKGDRSGNCRRRRSDANISSQSPQVELKTVESPGAMPVSIPVATPVLPGAGGSTGSVGNEPRL